MTYRPAISNTIKKTGIAAIFLFCFSATVLFWHHNTSHNILGNLLTLDYPMVLLALGRLAGLMAVFFILIQLVLIGRVRWVEQLFGLDRLIRVHQFTGILVILLVLAHPVLLGISYARQNDVTFLFQMKDFIKNWEDVGAAALGLAILVAALIFAPSFVRKRVRYETFYFAHLAVYLAIGLSISHQFEIGGDFNANRSFKFLWAAFYVFAGFNLIFYRFYRPARRFFKHGFYVADLIPESPDVTSVVINGRNLGSLPAGSGQFLMVRFLEKGFWTESHPFSISRRPDGNSLRLSIKNSGDFTARVPALKIGTKVLIDGPHGIFTSGNARRDKILLIAGGIGITPLFSLAEDFLKDGRDTLILYSNRTGANLVFGEELRSMAASSKCFRFIPVISNDPAWHGEAGRIDREKITKLAPDFLERDIFVCGPPPMMMSLVSGLRSMGAARSQIHYERFSF